MEKKEKKGGENAHCCVSSQWQSQLVSRERVFSVDTALIQADKLSSLELMQMFSEFPKHSEVPLAGSQRVAGMLPCKNLSKLVKQTI